jgi:hypothetical protein
MTTCWCYSKLYTSTSKFPFWALPSSDITWNMKLCLHARYDEISGSHMGITTVSIMIDHFVWCSTHISIFTFYKLCQITFIMLRFTTFMFKNVIGLSLQSTCFVCKCYHNFAITMEVFLQYGNNTHWASDTPESTSHVNLKWRYLSTYLCFVSNLSLIPKVIVVQTVSLLSCNWSHFVCSSFFKLPVLSQ